MTTPLETETTTVGAALFTDLVGFTEYNGSVGDVAALTVLDRQTELAVSVLDASPEARIVKELGDGLMIWFCSAEDGLAGAVALMQAIERDRLEGCFPLAVRMGMHHGPAMVRGDDLVGQTINIAARVSDLAGPQELLVSDQVIDACGRVPPVSLSPIGPVSVKGVKEPVWLQRVEGREESGR